MKCYLPKISFIFVSCFFLSKKKQKKKKGDTRGQAPLLAFSIYLKFPYLIIESTLIFFFDKLYKGI